MAENEKTSQKKGGLLTEGRTPPIPTTKTEKKGYTQPAPKQSGKTKPPVQKPKK